MADKIFVNYRRDDERAVAARVRDRLANAFGGANVFMDVDNLMAGQRFDKELDRALSETDVFLSVIGPRWVELLTERQRTAERDYVREEIAAALKRGITVIPLLIEQTRLPRADALPEDIRELVLHQKHVVSHERFGRDAAELIEAIRFARKPRRDRTMPDVPWQLVWTTAVCMTLLGWVAVYLLGIPVWVPWASSQQPSLPGTNKEQLEVAARENVMNEQQEKRRLADEKATADGVATKRKADEAEQQRLASIKADVARKIAEANAKLNAEQAAAKEGDTDPLRPGRVFRDCLDVCPEMVVVPAGKFIMGSNEGAGDERPPHSVAIRHPFAVGKFEVTFAEWDACVAGGGCTSNRSPDDGGWGKGRRPVINVSWNDAKEYVTWLSRKTRNTYRLLSEAEWEYAAKVGTTTNYSWGTDTGAGNANCRYCGSQWDDKQTAPVGSFNANGFGLHDMHGNVYEWCEDNWHPNYHGAPSDGSAWRGNRSSSSILRGGSWASTSTTLRSSERFDISPDESSSLIGFRIARTLPPA